MVQYLPITVGPHYVTGTYIMWYICEFFSLQVEIYKYEYKYMEHKYTYTEQDIHTVMSVHLLLVIDPTDFFLK